MSQKKTKQSQPKKESNFGRPTKYDPKYCEEIVDFFENAPLTQEYRETTASGGKAVEVIKTKCAEMPTFINFALKIGVDTDTLLNWSKEHQDFFGAYKRCKKIQENWLTQNGLQSNVNTAFGIFVAKNVLGWRDKTEQIHSFDDIDFEDEGDDS